MTALLTRPVRVLIVDDSAVIRKVLSMGLGADPMITVVGAAASADQAMEMIDALQPDVMTLDIEMPRLDGVSFLRQLMPVNPLPTVIISSATRRAASVTLDALAAGAVDVIAKPSLGVGEGLPVIMPEICHRVRAAATARVTTALRASALPAIRPLPNCDGGRLIAIGASTGGVQALAQILQDMPQDAPGIVIVQHMPAGFTQAFAKRLDQGCSITIREARDGDPVVRGTALVAPGGDLHMELRGRAPNWRVALVPGDPVCFSRPSVDWLFRSVARHAGRAAVAALLTGMGRDGAEGLLEIRRASGTTLAQDEDSSVVWGMPAAAVELGAANRVLPLPEIAEAILSAAGCPAIGATRAQLNPQGAAR